MGVSLSLCGHMWQFKSLRIAVFCYEAHEDVISFQRLCVFVFLCTSIELDKLDTEMIKLLAYQRIQQLFAPKVPSTQPPPTTSTTPKTSAPHPNSKTPLHYSLVCLLVKKSVFLLFDCCFVLIIKTYTLLLPGQKKVQARAVFYPLTGRGAAVSMCYRTLHIGSGRTFSRCDFDPAAFCALALSHS